MTVRRVLAAALLLASLTLAVPAHAASGALDTSFDGDGVFTFGLANPAEEGASGMAVDPSGRLIVGEGLFGSNMAVARVLPGGGLDPAFAGGVAQLTDGKSRSTNAVAAQSDGKVLVAGNDVNHGQNVFLVRYRANGTPDPNFGSTGVAHVQVCGTTATETNVFVRSDNSIVVVGWCGNGSTKNVVFVLAFKAGGTLDTGFSGDGKLQLAVGDSYFVRDAIIDSHDRLTVVGASATGTKPLKAALVRILPSGKLDTTFSGDGKALFDLAGGDDGARAIASLGGGRVLIVEQAVSAGGAAADVLLFALTAAGKLDTTWSGDGKATIDEDTFDNPWDVAIDGSDRIYIATTITFGVDEASAIRTKPNGSLDTTFAGGAAHAGTESQANWVVLWKGKPTIAGDVFTGTDFDALVARFQA
jgi:uncharacterized delta-60 repeat protein